ncbi:MAG: diguanylate cyclase domain-containing protein [Actinomycetota bacterium]
MSSAKAAKAASPETNGSRRGWLAPMSLRMRFAFGIGAVVLPVLLLAAAASVASRTTLAGFETAASTAAEEAIPLARLEAQLLVARAAGYDAVLDGGSGGAGFEEEADDVDRQFDKLLATEALEERALVQSAERSWQEALTIVESAGALPQDDRLVEMDRADVLYRAADGDLAAAERAAVAEQSRRLSDARALDTRTQRTAVVLLTAAVIAAVIAALSLARSLLRPLDLLKHGASRLRQRDLKHRVRVDRNDELGEVADGFNRMAEEIERVHRVLLQRALLDPLTKLGNRPLLMDRVGHALARRDRKDGDIALLMVDLDGFKEVNDRYGHLAGDQLLADAADRIKNCLRAQDSAARLGGDEFALLVEDLESSDEAIEVARRINQGLVTPFEVDDEQVALSASIGIAFARPDSTVDGLLREADLAMYEAKHRGKNGYAVARSALAADA